THKLVAHIDVVSHEFERVLRVPHALPVGTRFAQVHADVEHHPCRPHTLPVKHAKPVGRVVKIPEFFHEPPGVECPTFCVPGGAGKLPAPLIEHTAIYDGLPDLQIVTR